MEGHFKSMVGTGAYDTIISEQHWLLLECPTYPAPVVI